MLTLSDVFLRSKGEHLIILSSSISMISLSSKKLLLMSLTTLMIWHNSFGHDHSLSSFIKVIVSSMLYQLDNLPSLSVCLIMISLSHSSDKQVYP